MNTQQSYNLNVITCIRCNSYNLRVMACMCGNNYNWKRLRSTMASSPLWKNRCLILAGTTTTSMLAQLPRWSASRLIRAHLFLHYRAEQYDVAVNLPNGADICHFARRHARQPCWRLPHSHRLAWRLLSSSLSPAPCPSRAPRAARACASCRTCAEQPVTQ